MTSIKPYSIDANNQKQYSGNDYEVTYSDKQVIVTRHISGGKQQTYTYTIGNNGFVESYVDVADGNDEVKMEYDSASKECNNSICSNMNGPRDHHTE